MKKKAEMQAPAKWIVELVFVLFLIIIFLSVTTKVKDDSLHNLRVEARDYAFTRDAIAISPSQLDYKYDLDPNMTLTINQERCIVQTKYKNQRTLPTNFFCSKDTMVTITEQETIDNKMRIIKNA